MLMINAFDCECRMVLLFSMFLMDVFDVSKNLDVVICCE